MDAQKDALKHFETEVMLFVNERLYRKGVISEEVYFKAKEMILKLSKVSCTNARVLV